VERADVIDAARRFYREKAKQHFVAGETYIPPSGKLLDEDDLVHLVAASLDMWLTTGRFGKRFEVVFAKFFGAEFSSLTVSGSAANLLAFSLFTSH
jgi:CDP-6-deoxy-D-xylo-4-hexulose-3-dehydrase